MTSCVIYIIGGIIGNVNDVSVDLSNPGTDGSDENNNLIRYCFTDKEFDAIQSIKLSYSMLDLAEHSITVPLIAVTYLAPIYSLLKEQKVFADFVLYVYGKTGVMKSSIVAAFMSHFGSFDRDTFSSSFRDTLNRIEQKSFILKDTINVIDDFKPQRDYAKEITILEGILAMYGDRVRTWKNEQRWSNK